MTVDDTGNDAESENEDARPETASKKISSAAFARKIVPVLRENSSIYDPIHLTECGGHTLIYISKNSQAVNQFLKHVGIRGRRTNDYLASNVDTLRRRMNTIGYRVIRRRWPNIPPFFPPFLHYYLGNASKLEINYEALVEKEINASTMEFYDPSLPAVQEAVEASIRARGPGPGRPRKVPDGNPEQSSGDAALDPEQHPKGTVDTAPIPGRLPKCALFDPATATTAWSNSPEPEEPPTSRAVPVAFKYPTPGRFQMPHQLPPPSQSLFTYSPYVPSSGAPSRPIGFAPRETVLGELAHKVVAPGESTQNNLTPYTNPAGNGSTYEAHKTYVSLPSVYQMSAAMRSGASIAATSLSDHTPHADYRRDGSLSRSGSPAELQHSYVEYPSASPSSYYASVSPLVPSEIGLPSRTLTPPPICNASVPPPISNEPTPGMEKSRRRVKRADRKKAVVVEDTSDSDTSTPAAQRLKISTVEPDFGSKVIPVLTRYTDKQDALHLTYVSNYTLVYVSKDEEAVKDLLGNISLQSEGQKTHLASDATTFRRRLEDFGYRIVSETGNRTEFNVDGSSSSALFDYYIQDKECDVDYDAAVESEVEISRHRSASPTFSDGTAYGAEIEPTNDIVPFSHYVGAAPLSYMTFLTLSHPAPQSFDFPSHMGPKLQDLFEVLYNQKLRRT